MKAGSMGPESHLSPSVGLLLAHKSAEYKINVQKSVVGTSLVAQWFRIHLPMQGTRVRALAWEDPTGRGATKPMRHNY